MYVAVLTQSGHLYVFQFELSRAENWKEIRQSQMNNTVLMDEDGMEKLTSLVDYPYQKKYKEMLHQFDYVPKYPNAKKSRKGKKVEPDPEEESGEPKKPY